MKSNISYKLIIVLFLLISSQNYQILFAHHKVIDPDSSKYLNNPNYVQQISLYDVYQTKQADIVMLGNSLTQGADWRELLDRPNVVGRGITSDILDGMYARLNYIYKLKPKLVFIMGGVNDIYNWTPIQTIYQVYIKIVESLKVRGIQPVIQSLLYAGEDWGKEWIAKNNPKFNSHDVNQERNNQIKSLNRLLESYAKRNGIIFLELNSKMADPENFLRKELTWDGIHLNGQGYKIWSKEIDKVLTNLGY